MSAQLASQQQTEPSSFRRALSLISSSPPPRQEEQQEQGQAEQGQEKTADNEQQLQFGGPMPGGHPAFEPDALAHLMASFAAHHHQQQQQQQQNGGGQLGPPMLPPMGQPMPPDFPAALLAQFPVPFGPFAHGPPPHHHQQNGALPPPGAGGPQQPMPPFPFPLDAASLAAFQPFMLPPENRPRKNATREVTAPLKHWLNEHRKNPYPTKAEKTLLACLTRMTMTQVSTWFANARRRLKKENKMTWSPRNRPNEDEDEDGDGDGPLGSQSGEGPSSSGSPAATHQQALEADEAAQKQLQQRKSLARERCGIWSIADTLGEQVVSSREEENKNQQNGQAETDGREQFSNNHRQQHQQEEVGPEETGNAVAGNGHPQHPQLGPLTNGQLPLLDGLFPPGMLPPQLALSLGLPPGPDPQFLLALAMQQHQQQQQPPPLPPPPPHRLLQLNPFVLLAQHLTMANCQPPMAKADPSPAMAPADQAPPLPTPTMPSSAGGPSPPLAPPPSMPPASSLAGHKRSAPKSEASSTAAPEGLPMAKRQCRPAQS